MSQIGRAVAAIAVAVGVAGALVLGAAGSAAASGEPRGAVLLWHTETEPQSVAALGTLIAEFEKLHPGVRIKQEALAWGDLEKRLNAALAAGTPPDLSHGQAITCAAFAAKGLLRALDDVVESLGRDNLIRDFRNLCRVQGKFYGIGHAAASSLFVYRKDLFDQKGLKPPRRWNELIEMAAALTETKDGKVTRYGLTLSGQPLFVNIQVGELLKSNGGRLFDGEGRPTLTEKPVIELLEFYQKLARVLPPDWLGHSYLDTFAAMASGKAAMQYQAYGRGVGYIEKSAPFEMADPRHFAVTDKVVGPSGKGPAAQIDSEPWMVFRQARNPELAAAFLKFFYREDNYIRYLHSVPVHLLPTTRSTYRNPRYLEHPTIKKWRSWIDMQEAYFLTDRTRPTLAIEWSDTRVAPLAELLDSGIIADMVHDAVKGMAPAEAAAKAQRRVEDLLARTPRPQ